MTKFKNFRRVVIVVVFEKKPLKINIIPSDRSISFSYFHILICIYQGCCYTSHNLFADTHTPYRTLYWYQMCREYMSLRIIDLKNLKKQFHWFIWWHIAAGRKRWMTLVGPTYHHTLIYTILCIKLYGSVCVWSLAVNA
jgi:hypothetical protein